MGRGALSSTPVSIVFLCCLYVYNTILTPTMQPGKAFLLLHIIMMADRRYYIYGWSLKCIVLIHVHIKVMHVEWKLMCMHGNDSLRHAVRGTYCTGHLNYINTVSSNVCVMQAQPF